MSPTLLSLPQELRDFIIEYAITSGGIAPSKLNKETPTTEYNDLTYVSRIGGSGLLYALKEHHTSPSSLLLVNHQLHDETKAALKRLSTANGSKYELDIILANEEMMYPTWTYVPPLAQEIDSFAVNIRIIGVGGKESNGFMDASGSTGASVWRLYSILERFLRCGAAPARSPSEDRELRVKLLDINVETPSNVDKSLLANNIAPDNLPKHRRENPPHNAVMHPESLAKFIYVWIEGILRLSDPSYALPSTPITKYSKLLFERVSEVRFSVDGERLYDADQDIFYEIDIGEMARDITERNAWFDKSLSG